MPKRIINPPALPRPINYNHAVGVTGGEMLFLAGQDASDETGAIVAPGDIVTQYEQVLRNLFVVMKEAGGTMQDIVKLNIFLTDARKYTENLEALREVHRAYFEESYPATGLFEVKSLYRRDALVVCEGIAVIEPRETS
jgi:2-iminobutanoate/2-iminopropanoate deaminase